MMNSSRAIDSLSMLISRWHSLSRHVSYTLSRRRQVGGDVLREEELELLVCELAQLGAEHVVNADVVCIASGGGAASVYRYRYMCMCVLGLVAEGCEPGGAAVQWLLLTQDRPLPATGPC
jgi:hypothetical protein